PCSRACSPASGSRVDPFFGLLSSLIIKPPAYLRRNAPRGAASKRVGGAGHAAKAGPGADGRGRVAPQGGLRHPAAVPQSLVAAVDDRRGAERRRAVPAVRGGAL